MPRFLLIDEIEDLRQSDQASLLSLMQDGVLTETKVSKTKRIKFKCSRLVCDM
jgi:MoxR-like ATPase